jgi:predicted membrane protein
MHNSETILTYSLLAILGLNAILLTTLTAPSISNYFYKRSPGEHFDSSRIPLYIVTVTFVAAICLIYSFIISRRIELTLQFTGIATAIFGVACIKLILYKQEK